MSGFLDITRDGAVATVTFNRPEMRNAVSTFEDCDELKTSFQGLNDDRSVRCIIITGAGSSFSAGGDLKKMRDGVGLGGGATSAEVRRSYDAGVRGVIRTLYNLDVPMVAAVNGPAIGLGCDLAALCDVRIAAEKAVFAMSFVKAGLVPGDGGAWILPRVIGMSRAMRMILTGAPVSAEEALAIGLIEQVVTPEALLDRAREIAAGIAANPPEATRLAKRLVKAASGMELDATLDLSAAYQAILHKTSDHTEAVTAIIEKRTANFTGD